MNVVLQLELLELRKQQQEIEQFIKDEQRSDKDSRYTHMHKNDMHTAHIELFSYNHHKRDFSYCKQIS